MARQGGGSVRRFAVALGVDRASPFAWVNSPLQPRIRQSPVRAISTACGAISREKSLVVEALRRCNRPAGPPSPVLRPR